MDALKMLKSRYSVRAYKNEMPSKEVIDKILEAGTFAPTGRGLQSPIIICVQNKVLRDEISELNRKVLGCDTDPFYGAPCILIVLADKKYPTYLYDGSLVMGNLMNAAYAVGLGSCWIHRAKEVFESKRGKDLLSDWGIEGDYEGIGHVALGYPSVPQGDRKPRKDNYIKYI